MSECSDNIKDTVSVMEDVGFIIHQQKSVFVPTQNIVFLGNHIDSVRMIVFLTDERKHVIIFECSTLIGTTITCIRAMARVIGLLVASFSAVEYGPLHYRTLERAKTSALSESRGNFGAKMFLSDSVKSELKWWIRNLLQSEIFPMAHQSFL
jgi:hypothetical protein